MSSRRTIGLFLRGLTYSYQTEIVRGAHDECVAFDLNLLCFAGGRVVDNDPASQVFELPGPDALDAVIWVPGTMAGDERSEKLVELIERFRGKPMCTIGVPYPGVPLVYVDNRSGVRELTRHLADVHGRRKIAFVCGHSVEAEERLAGYRQGLARSQIEFDERLVLPGDFTSDAGYRAVELLFSDRERRCDAIVAANDWTAFGALEALEAQGIRVPEDVALVGFDDVEEASFLTPPLTTIRQPPRQLGTEAVRLVHALLEGRSAPTRVSLTTQPRIRQSCGCFTSNPRRRPVARAEPLGLDGLERLKLVAVEALAAARPNIEHQIDETWAEQLVDAWLSDLRAGEQQAFLPNVRRLVANSAYLGNITAWHAAVTALRNATAERLVGDPELWLMAEASFESAHVLIGNEAERTQARRRLEKEILMRRLEEVSSLVRAALSPPVLRRALASSLQKLGIPSSLVAVFPDDNVVHGAQSKVLMACDETKQTSEDVNGLVFSSLEVLPAELRPARRYTMIVRSLHFDAEQLGFCVLERGPHDGLAYKTITELVSSALKAGELSRAIAEEATRRERAERARMQQQLEIAARIQTGILPRDLHVEGAEIAATMLPATEVGGDYFDVLPRPDGAWFGIGDVAGHGLKTGLVMLMIQSIVAATIHARPDARPWEAWVVLNAVLRDNVRVRLEQDEHATLTLIRYFADGRIAYAGAHEDILIYRARSGHVEQLQTHGLWVGISEDLLAESVTDAEARLEVGDVMLLYSDGVIEAMNADRQLFGIEALKSALAEFGRADVHRIRDEIVERVHRWMAQRFDDLTLVVVRYLGESTKA